MASHSSFGIDLASDNYELHPSSKDSNNRLTGNYIATIKFTETLSHQLNDFISRHECHDGMQIGHIQFTSSKNGNISFDTINTNLSHCSLTIQEEEKRRLHEMYQTEYDRPPSNAMFLKRKGFVHTKLIVKPIVSAVKFSHHQTNIPYFKRKIACLSYVHYVSISLQNEHIAIQVLVFETKSQREQKQQLKMLKHPIDIIQENDSFPICRMLHQINEEK